MLVCREMGGKVYPGQVKEKEEAQKQYDKAKQRGQSAGQVKQKSVTTSLFCADSLYLSLSHNTRAYTHMCMH